MKRKTDTATKPYNQCIPCAHRIAHRCDGPRTSAMPLSRWCEFMRDMKEVNGLTNAEIAEKSGVSVKRIEQLMAQNCDQDIMRETARRIEDAIIGSSNQYPCYLAFEKSIPDNSEQLSVAMRDLERALNDKEDYRAVLENIHSAYSAEMQKIREEAKAKIDYLLAQVDRLNKENENLWAENIRKSKVVDMFIEKQNILLTEKKP